MPLSVNLLQGAGQDANRQTSIWFLFSQGQTRVWPPGCVQGELPSDRLPRLSDIWVDLRGEVSYRRGWRTGNQEPSVSRTTPWCTLHRSSSDMLLRKSAPYSHRSSFLQPEHRTSQDKPHDVSLVWSPPVSFHQSSLQSDVPVHQAFFLLAIPIPSEAQQKRTRNSANQSKSGYVSFCILFIMTYLCINIQI